MENEVTPKQNGMATSVKASACKVSHDVHMGTTREPGPGRTRPARQCCFAPSSWTFTFPRSERDRTSFRACTLSAILFEG